MTKLTTKLTRKPLKPVKFDTFGPLTSTERLSTVSSPFMVNKSSLKDFIKRTLGPILRVATLLAKNPSAYSFVENAHIDKRKKISFEYLSMSVN